MKCDQLRFWLLSNIWRLMTAGHNQQSWLSTVICDIDLADQLGICSCIRCKSVCSATEMTSTVCSTELNLYTRSLQFTTKQCMIHRLL